MDVDTDGDIDGCLLQQFSSLGTTDKDVLISEFQRLIGNQLNPSSCAFFLDMTNWNLPAAIGAYYDFQHPSSYARIPSMSLLKDVTIGEGESVPPFTAFIKTWRIQNAGQEAWPPGCSLRFLSGTQFGCPDQIMVSALQPGAVTDVNVKMMSPAEVGIYQGQWRMNTATGVLFGEVIWVIVHVEECGLLGLTQQLSRVGCGDGNMNLSMPLGISCTPPSAPACHPPPPSPVQGQDIPSPPAPARLCMALSQEGGHSEEEMERTT